MEPIAILFWSISLKAVAKQESSFFLKNLRKIASSTFFIVHTRFHLTAFRYFQLNFSFILVLFLLLNVSNIILFPCNHCNHLQKKYSFMHFCVHVKSRGREIVGRTYGETVRGRRTVKYTRCIRLINLWFINRLFKNIKKL